MTNMLFKEGEKKGKLDGKVAIVTGNIRHGQRFCKTVRSRRSKVVVTGRNEERTKAFVDDIKGVNTVKAHTICKQLNLRTIEDLTKLTTKKLVKVPGIGPITSQKIITSLFRSDD